MDGATRLTDLLTELLDLVSDGPPSASRIDEFLRDRATSRVIAGPTLSHPTWAREVGGAADVYLGLDGDVEGVRLHEDPRGWGAYANVAVRRGSLADVESVVGPTAPMARNPDDFTSGERVAAYVDRSGWTVRVFTELGSDGQSIRQITLSYPSRDTPRRVATERPTVAQPTPPAAMASADRCPRCAATVADSTAFCGSCGAFLDWSRE